MGVRKGEKITPFKELTDKKERMKVRKKAYKLFTKLRGSQHTRIQMHENISSKTGMTMEQVRYYREKDQWDKRLKKELAEGLHEKEFEREKEKALANLNTKTSIKSINRLLEEAALPQRWNMFIIYYLQSFNATQAALNIGCTRYSAKNTGYEILHNPKVKNVLKQCKEIMQSDIYVSAHDVLNDYIKIAKADITDYVEVIDGVVRVKDTDSIDGTLVTELKQGRDGITIKLADKMKALDRLEKLFNIIPDRKLQLEREKFEWQKELVEKQQGEGNSTVTIINDIG